MMKLLGSGYICREEGRRAAFFFSLYDYDLSTALGLPTIYYTFEHCQNQDDVKSRVRIIDE
jgi:hypothetical protein